MADRLSIRAAKCAATVLGAIALAACGTTKNSQDVSDASKKQYREAIGVYANPGTGEGLDPIAAAAFWGTRYNREQSDPEIAIKFSDALRKIGSVDESISVMQKASAKFPQNPDVSLEYGKALVEGGRAFEAVRHIETAAAGKPDDWTALSAYGVALDQIGEHETARQKYDRALALAPGAVTVLNNKGLSYAMDGKLDLARQTLRMAAASAGADSRVRQNLALVLAIGGNMKDAERLARSDLPPQVADNNIDFFRSIVNQPAYWDEYAATGVDVPAFEPAPAKPQPAPQPKPQLREEPKKQDDKKDGEPIALIEATPVTRASASEESADTKENAKAQSDQPVDSKTDDAVGGVELKKDN